MSRVSASPLQVEKRRRDLLASLPTLLSRDVSALEARDDGTEWEQPKALANQSPGLTTWLRWYAGQSSVRLEQATEYLEQSIESGAGFQEREVLQYAYLTRDDSERLSDDAEPFESRPDTVGELVGVAEVCASLELKRMQLKRLRDRGAFPMPVAELAAGPIWRKDQVEAWRFTNR